MNIDGLGEETIDLIYRNGLAKNIADLYTLKLVNLAYLDRLGDKSGRKILASLEKSKSVPFERVLFALGIRYVGETVAKKLASALENIDNIMSATAAELACIDEIGEVIAQSVEEYFKEPANREIVERLRSYGLQMEISKEKAALKTDKLAGKIIVISGTFEKHSREELKELIELNGGKNSSSISSKTNFILAGANMGPAKEEKANKLGIKMINEDEFLELIN